MAKARFKKPHGEVTTVLRFGAAARTLTASGAGQTYSMDLPAVGFERWMPAETYRARREDAYQLTALAKTVCELHGITDKPRSLPAGAGTAMA